MSFLKTHFGDKRPQTSNLPNSNQILNDPENVDDSEIIGSPNIENKQDVDIELDDNNGDDAQINSLPTTPKFSFTGYTHSPNIKKNKCSEYSSSAASVLKTYLDDKKSKKERSSDHLTSFFKSMEDTVRTFSPMRQIEIKSKISALVTEYEIKNLTEVYPQHVFSNQYSYSPSNSTSSNQSHFEQPALSTETAQRSEAHNNDGRTEPHNMLFSNNQYTEL